MEGKDRWKASKNLNGEISTRDKSITETENKMVKKGGTGLFWGSRKACSRKWHFNYILNDQPAVWRLGWSCGGSFPHSKREQQVHKAGERAMCVRKGRLGWGTGAEWEMVEWNKTGWGRRGRSLHPNMGFQLCFKCSKKPLEVFYKGGHDLIYVLKRPSAAVWGLNGRRETN